MTDVQFRFRKGAGSNLDVLFGTVTLKPTLAHSRGTSMVLPSPSTWDIINGEVLATNVQPTPEPVGGVLEWGYEVTVKDRHGKSYSFLVGVPDSTTAVEFVSLPRYFETKPPLFGQGPKGDAGEAATISVGTVTSGTTAKVTNSGTSSDAKLDFVLPQGPKGDKGDGTFDEYRSANGQPPYRNVNDAPSTYPKGVITGLYASVEGWPHAPFSNVITFSGIYGGSKTQITTPYNGSSGEPLIRYGISATAWSAFKPLRGELATTSANGLMSSADKVKLDNIGVLAYRSKTPSNAPSTYPSGTSVGLMSVTDGWPELEGNISGSVIVRTDKPLGYNSATQWVSGHKVNDTSLDPTATIMYREGSTIGSWGKWQSLATQEYVTSRTGTVTPEQYGAVGNGTTDDSDAIETAINENLTTGRKILFDSAKTYRITRPIISTVPTNNSQKYSVDLDSTSGGKATIHMDNDGHRHFEFSGAEIGGSVSLTANTFIQNRGWKVSSTTAFQKGMLMSVVSSQSWYYDPRPESTDARVSELHSVLSKDSTTLYSEAPSGEGYRVADNTVTVTPIVPITVNVKNLILTRPTPPTVAPDADLNYVGIRIVYARDSYVRDCIIENACAVAVQTRFCYNTVVESCKIDGTNAYGTGYAVTFSSTNFCTLRNSYITNTRRAADVSAVGNVVGRNTVMEGNTFVGGGKNVRGDWFGWVPDTQALASRNGGFGGHGVSADTIIRNNVTYNCWEPYLARGANTIISDNVHYGDVRIAVVGMDNGGGTIIVTGNKAVSGWLGSQKYVFEANARRARDFIRFGGALDDNSRVRVLNNYAEVRDGFICAGNRLNGTNKLVRFLTVIGNSVGFSNGSTDSGALLDNPSGALVDIGGTRHWQIGANAMMHDTLAGNVLLTRNLNISGAKVIDWSTSGATT